MNIINEHTKDFLVNIFNCIWLWAGFLALLVVFYALSTKDSPAVPRLFDIRGIVCGYYCVFERKKDFWSLLILISLLTRITILSNPASDDSFSEIGVILSLLVSAIIGLIPMALSKSDNIQGLNTKDRSHRKKVIYIEDIAQVGMFDILISMIDLIMIFLSNGIQPIGPNQLLPSVLDYLIYWLFYLFAFNILIIMHKLYVVYFE